MGKKEVKKRGVYVVRSEEAEIKELEARKKSETKGVYVVKTNEEVVNKYRGVIQQFADAPGVFVLVTRDKTFFQTFRSAMVALGLRGDVIHMVPRLSQVPFCIQTLKRDGVTLFLFMEYAVDSELSLSTLRYVRGENKDIKIVVLSRELNRERLFQFYEDGASSFLKKPASINSVIIKIAYMLKPQCEVDALVEEGREHIRDNRFEEALELAESVLKKWPRNAAAMVILGDAKKGLARREEALKAYKKAERNSSDYLEPLQKIVELCDEQGDRAEALKYLGKLDRMSPLNCNRKIQIAERHFEQGNASEAERYFDDAIDSAKEEAMGVVGEMSLDIAEAASRHDPKLAAKYYRRSLDMVKNSKSALTMSVYNRLGISLRKQGLWGEAIEAYVEAARYSPDDENIQYNIALAYEEGQKYEDAAAYMLTAIAINPDMYKDRPELAYNIGAALARGGKPKQAVECLTYLQEIAPGFKDSKKLLKEVTVAGKRSYVL
ncbi:MAG: tetratricopeptide repeat protein [Desulfovibrionaceae bacterium]|nr:tetratricopeptide repeat protein [Desulfovibrionaceae bacterium]